MVQSKLLTDLGVLHAVSERSDKNLSFAWGNHDEVVRSRRDFFEKLGIELVQTIWISMEHGDTILTVDEHHRGCGALSPETLLGPADAMLTVQSGIALVILTADCVPLALFAPDKNVIALVHAGWRGTEKRIVEKSVQNLQTEFGVDTTKLIAYLGPSILPASYLFDKGTLQQDETLWKPYIKEIDESKVAIDVAGFNVDQLQGCGVEQENIEQSPVDTGADEHYFSHYRDSRNGTPEGRFASVLMLR